MKKLILLSIYLLCIKGITSCGNLNASVTDVEADIFTNDSEQYIEKSENNSSCSVGDSCNDTALINNSRTEADFREFGEREKRSHLYTNSGAGNNLSASIPPAVENDLVEDEYVEEDTFVENEPEEEDVKIVEIEEDDFSKTISFELEENPVEKVIENDELNKDPFAYEIESVTQAGVDYAKDKVEQNKVVKTVRIVEEIIEEKQANQEKEVQTAEAEFSVICEDNCDDLFLEGDRNISSEFTEESFDIEEFVSGDDEEINIETDNKNTIIAEIDTEIKEVKVSDDTVLIWEAKEGDNVRELLTKWSSMSGWKLLWNTNRNYILSAGVTFKGKFADVSSALIRAFARARPAPVATYYKGNRVIVVETMENENAY